MARDPRTGDLGVASQSKFLAVGSVVPHAAAELGAIATQALSNVSYGSKGLELLRGGASATETVATLLAADVLPERRQAAIVDNEGTVAIHTGSGCTGWAGGRVEDNFGCIGNMLTGEEVVHAMAASMQASAGEPVLSRRLVAALLAGADAGGDRRGQQSAVVLVTRLGGGYGGYTDRMVDLRVDDHEAPIVELSRLLDLRDLYFERSDPAALLTLTGSLLKEVAAALTVCGYRPSGGSPPEVWRSLESWAGRENVEERTTNAGMIDPVVLALLRAKAEPGAQ